MVEIIKITKKGKECLKIINTNNISFILLNFKQSFYKKIDKINKFMLFFVYTYSNFYLRIIWRGKAFRVRYFKKNNKFTFNFGYSHWTKLTFNPQVYSFTKVKRQNYLMTFRDWWRLSLVTKLFNELRTMNKYTKRGIRVKNTPYIRRFGKISQVNSSLHSFG